MSIKDFFVNSTVRYFFVGAIGAIVEIFLFMVFIRAGGQIVYSNIIAFHCAFALCYFLHYYYTHQKPYEGARNVISGFLKYAGLMYTQLFAGSILLWFLINNLGWQPGVSKILQIGVVTPIGYIVQKLLIFRRTPPL